MPCSAAARPATATQGRMLVLSSALSGPVRVPACTEQFAALEGAPSLQVNALKLVTTTSRAAHR